MSDNQKYYYLRLKENFFDTDAMIILETMQDGYLYSNILMKLYLRSLKDKGRLMFNNKIPYNSTMLAQITRHQVGTVEKAVKTFHELGLIELLDNGAIYISDIQDFIGKSSTEADRKRSYRERIEAEKDGKLLESGQMSGQSSDNPPPKKNRIEKNKINYSIMVNMTEEQYNKLIEKFGEAGTKDRIENLSLYKQSKGKHYKCDYSTILAWERKEDKNNPKYERNDKEIDLYSNEN